MHPLQTQAWADFRRKMGLIVEIRNNWIITFHKIPYSHFTVGYFPKGPEPTPEMLNTLRHIGTKHHALFIQLEPNTTNYESRITNYELRISHRPLFTKYTFILDLTKSEEVLLKNMHPKTRYNIKVAQKHGVQIVHDDSDTSFEEFIRLSGKTTNRQKFYAHNETYLRTMWETMKNAGIASLWRGIYEGNTLSAWIIFTHGDTVYYPYGTSSRENTNVMAPTLLLWEIARWGKKNGYKKFDLWGALGPDPDPNDPWYGFHRFKAGFNPDLVEFAGSFDLVLKPTLYRLYCVANDVRWKILKILK